MNITDDEYRSITINRLSSENQLFAEFVCKLILQGKITLDEIPRNLRIKHKDFYLSSFRISREAFAKDCKIAFEDINYMSVPDKETMSDVIDNTYSSFAKSARQEGIDPDDINLAIETIKTMRKGKGDVEN